MIAINSIEYMKKEVSGDQSGGDSKKPEDHIPNWHDQHKGELKSMSLMNWMTTKVIPAFIQMADLYKLDVEGISQDPKQMEKNRRLLDDVLSKVPSELKSEINENIKITGLNRRIEFKSVKGQAIFNSSEVCALAIIQATCNYLEQSSTIGENVLHSEQDDSAYFYKLSIVYAINNHFHEIRRIIWNEKVRSWGLTCYQFRWVKSCFTAAVFLLDYLTPVSSKLQRALRVALINLMEEMIEKEDEFKISSDMIGANRCYGVLDAGRKLVGKFIQRSLEALTGTIVHFWITIRSLSDSDRAQLDTLCEVMSCLENDVNAALHKFALVSEGRMRPFGFIMNAALADCLPSDPVKNKIVQNIRLQLQECISIYSNWRFQYVTNFPRPLQAGSSKLSKLCNLYQSVIESDDDFKVVYKCALELNNQVKQRLEDGKSVDGPVDGPWNLLAVLKRNFNYQQQELVLTQQQKPLPTKPIVL